MRLISPGTALPGEQRRSFRNHFVKRIDEVVVFRDLDEDDIRQILGSMVDPLLQAP